MGYAPVHDRRSVRGPHVGFPNPYFDLDYAFDRNVEAEITSESAAFPTANVSYYTNFYFMRWHYFNGWLWESHWGTLSYDEQLSEQQPFGDKWDTTGDFGRYCCANAGAKDYPYQAPPGTLAHTAPETASVVQNVRTGADAGLPADMGKELYSLATTADQAEVRIVPDLSGGVTSYARSANALAAAVVAQGRIERDHYLCEARRTR